MTDVVGQIMLMVGAVLRIVGLLAASRAPTHKILVVTPSPSHDSQNCLQTLPRISFRRKKSRPYLVENN